MDIQRNEATNVPTRSVGTKFTSLLASSVTQEETNLFGAIKICKWVGLFHPTGFAWPFAKVCTQVITSITDAYKKSFHGFDAMVALLVFRPPTKSGGCREIMDRGRKLQRRGHDTIARTNGQSVAFPRAESEPLDRASGFGHRFSWEYGPAGLLFCSLARGWGWKRLSRQSPTSIGTI